MENILV